MYYDDFYQEWTKTVHDWAEENIPKQVEIFVKDSIETYAHIVSYMKDNNKIGLLPVGNCFNVTQLFGMGLVEQLRDYLAQMKKIRTDSVEARNGLSYYSYEHFSCGDFYADICLDELNGFLIYYRDRNGLIGKYNKWKETDITQHSTKS